VTESKKSSGDRPSTTPTDAKSRLDRSIAEQLVARARAEGVDLVGPDGLLAGLTKQVLETSLEVELDEHLGYAKHDRRSEDSSNSRNGSRSKTVLTEVGPIEVNVPRDRDATFDPKIVRKRQRRLDGVDAMVISLVAKGLTTGEVQAHLAEVYGAEVSRETISKITDRVLDELAGWANRPLDRVYPVLFIDALVVKIRDGQVTNRPVYTAVGVTVDGEREILGLWVGTGGEGAKFWLQVLTEVKNRGVEDVCIVVCDGLKGLPEAIAATWPLAIVQTCVLHLIRNTFRLASRADWDAMARDLRPIYVAPSEQAAKERFGEFAATWGEKYPAVIRLWETNWAEFSPFLDYSPEIRRVIYSTNAVESLHARFRRATRARGHFPNEQAAIKCLYLVVRSLDPTGKGRKRWTSRWKPALNAFAITFEGRVLPTNT
jgi:putative transposase